MGWLITLGILALMAILPLGVSVKYDSVGPLIRLILGPVRFTVFPMKKKEKKEQPQKEKKVKEKKADSLPEKPEIPPKPETQEEKQNGGSWTDFLPLLKTALDFLGAFRRKLRVNYLELKLILAGDDPCDLGLSYGRAWAAVGNLMPQLDKLFVIKKRNVEVECDFTATETLVIARLDLTITLGRLVGTAVWYGFRILKEFIQIKNKRKGGAKQ